MVPLRFLFSSWITQQAGAERQIKKKTEKTKKRRKREKKKKKKKIIPKENKIDGEWRIFFRGDLSPVSREKRRETRKRKTKRLMQRRGVDRKGNEKIKTE